MPKANLTLNTTLTEAEAESLKAIAQVNGVKLREFVTTKLRDIIANYGQQTSDRDSMILPPEKGDWHCRRCLRVRPPEQRLATGWCTVCVESVAARDREGKQDK